MATRLEQMASVSPVSDIMESPQSTPEPIVSTPKLGGIGVSSGVSLVAPFAGHRQHQCSTPRIGYGVPNSNCAGCKQPICDKYFLEAADHVWHEECLKCSRCQCRLADHGSLFTRENMLLCKVDYLRMLGVKGQCSACHRSIPGGELVMRAKENAYHLQCFACDECRVRFSPGDHVYVWSQRLLCGPDYEDLLHQNYMKPKLQSELLRSSYHHYLPPRNVFGSPAVNNAANASMPFAYPSATAGPV